jgi:hypothetical protein
MIDGGTLTDFSVFQARIQSPSLRAIAGHWNEVRGKRRMPSWAHLKNTVLEPHMKTVWAFNYDRGSGEFVGRFAGNTIMVSFGKSFLGTPLRDLHAPAVFQITQSYFTRAVTEPACARWSGKLFKVGDQIVEGERICLPMSTAAEHADGVLGASAYDFPVWRTPDTLELLHDIVEWCKI